MSTLWPSRWWWALAPRRPSAWSDAIPKINTGLRFYTEHYQPNSHAMRWSSRGFVSMTMWTVFPSWTGPWPKSLDSSRCRTSARPRSCTYGRPERPVIIKITTFNSSLSRRRSDFNKKTFRCQGFYLHWMRSSIFNLERPQFMTTFKSFEKFRKHLDSNGILGSLKLKPCYSLRQNYILSSRLDVHPGDSTISSLKHPQEFAYKKGILGP